MKNIFHNSIKATTGLALGHFSIELYASVLIPLYPIITQKLGANLATISLVIAIAHFTSCISQPYFGYISDKLNHRFFLIWGIAASALFIPLSTKFNNAFLFLIFMLFGMIGSASFHPQASTLMKDFNKNNPDFSKMMGLFLGLGTIGYALGPYLGTFFCKHFGFDNLIYISLIGILSALFMYFYIPKVPEGLHPDKGNFFEIVKEISKNKICRFLVLVSAVKSAVSMCFCAYIPFLLKDSGFDLAITGIVVSLFLVAGGFATILSSRFEKVLGAKGTIALSMLSIAPCLACFLVFLNKHPVFAIVSFVLSGFFVLLSVGIILVLAQRAMPKYTGVISGVIQGVGWGIGGLVLAPAGVVAQIWGVDKVLIIVALTAFFVGLGCIKNIKPDIKIDIKNR